MLFGNIKKGFNTILHFVKDQTQSKTRHGKLEKYVFLEADKFNCFHADKLQLTN